MLGCFNVLRAVIVTRIASKPLHSTEARKLRKSAAFIAAVLAVLCGTEIGASAGGRAVAYVSRGYHSFAATFARAERGDPVAEARLGWMFSTGRGVPQNYYEAAKWLYRAATRGNAAAQFALGMLYNKGQGVPRDYVLSYMWLNLSAAQAVGADREFKINMRDSIASKMTRRQLLTAQQMALKWYKSK